MPSKTRYDRSDIRRLNAVNVIDQLRRNGAMSRATIASRLGLTRATVSNIVSDLMDASLVSETEYTEGKVGRPGLLLNLNPDCGCMIAVEIDLDRVTVVVANVGQDLLWKDSVLVISGATAEDTLKSAALLVDRAMSEGGDRGLKCLGIGVAWAGLVNHESGELVYGPTSGWSHIPLKSDWEARFGVSVFVENQANAGAIAAQHLGVRRGVGNLIYLSVGLGMAAGIFVDGVLLRGSQGFAGQVGHTWYADNGVNCSCGHQGCWVTEVGVLAVHRRLLARGVELPLGSESNVEWLDDVCDRAKAGDRIILSVLEEVGAQLGRGLSRLVQSFNPSVVIVGGRMGGVMRLCEDSVLSSFRASALPYMQEEMELLISENDADHQMGCLATVFDAIMQNPLMGDGK